MSLRRTFIWLAVAPLGIGLTTGLTITTTLLTQQPIGLASEPLSAGDAGRSLEGGDGRNVTVDLSRPAVATAARLLSSSRLSGVLPRDLGPPSTRLLPLGLALRTGCRRT